MVSPGDKKIRICIPHMIKWDKRGKLLVGDPELAYESGMIGSPDHFFEIACLDVSGEREPRHPRHESIIFHNDSIPLVPRLKSRHRLIYPHGQSSQRDARTCAYLRARHS